MNLQTKKNLVLFGAVFGAAIFFFLPEIIASMKPEETNNVQPVFIPPTTAPLGVVVENSKIEIEPISERDEQLEQLEYNSKVAQLEAMIAEANNKKFKAEMENRKEKAEIDKINAEILRVHSQIKIDQMEADTNAKNAAKKAEASPPIAAAPMPQIAPIMPSFPTVASEPQPTQNLRSIRSVQVNRITGSTATISIDGEMETLGIGSVFNGEKLISINSDGRSIITQNTKSGIRTPRYLSVSASRRFAELTPLDDQNGGDTKSDSNSDMPSDISLLGN